MNHLFLNVLFFIFLLWVVLIDFLPHPAFARVAGIFVSSALDYLFYCYYWLWRDSKPIDPPALCIFITVSTTFSSAILGS